jgi:hypothetical protein
VVDQSEIDGSFVPRLRRDVSYAELDGEMVVTSPIDDQQQFNNFDAHWLGGTASIVWKTLDGSSSVDQVADLLSTAFDADVETVRSDVLELIRTLARAGLFEGIPAERPAPPPTQPSGVPAGTELPFFRLLDLDGREHTTDELRGTRSLLVNWSPTCGFCTGMAADLAALDPILTAKGVQLVLMAHGDADRNQRVRDESALRCPILLLGEFLPFEGLGTPSAYLLDSTGRVENALVVGADQLMAMVQYLADDDGPG